MTTLPIAEIVEDYTLYPRHDVDQSHIASLVLAIKAGTQLPPLVVDKKTKKLVDGFHRLEAYRRTVGDTASVDCELKSYKSRADLLLDAISLNASHGRKLDRVDQVRVVWLAEQVGITPVQIATVLHVPAERIETLRVRVATIPAGGNGQSVPGTNQIPLKRPVSHLAGTTLTSAQAASMRSVPGTSYLLIARQLTDALQHRLINENDQKLHNALVELADALEAYLAQG